MPDMRRLSLENKNKTENSRQPIRNETEGDMIFSTDVTSMPGTGREPIPVNSQSSMGDGIEETKSS